MQVWQRFGRSRLSYDSRDSSGGTEEIHETSEQRSGSWSITHSQLPAWCHGLLTILGWPYYDEPCSN
jgi:hypothetical protein